MWTNTLYTVLVYRHNDELAMHNTYMGKLSVHVHYLKQQKM